MNDLDSMSNPYNSKNERLARDWLLPLLGVAEVIGTKGKSSGQYALGLSDRMNRNAQDWDTRQAEARMQAIERARQERLDKQNEERFGWERQKADSDKNYQIELADAMNSTSPTERDRKIYDIELKYGRRQIPAPQADPSESLPELSESMASGIYDPVLQSLVKSASKGDKMAKAMFWKNWKPESRPEPKEPVSRATKAADEWQGYVTPEILKTIKDPFMKQIAERAMVPGEVQAEKYVMSKYKTSATDTKAEDAKKMLNDYLITANITGPSGRAGGLFKQGANALFGAYPSTGQLAKQSKGMGLIIARILQGSSLQVSNMDAKAGDAFVFNPMDTPQEFELKNAVFENMLDNTKTLEERRKFLYDSYKKITGNDPYKPLNANSAVSDTSRSTNNQSTWTADKEQRYQELLRKKQSGALQ